MPQRDYSHQDLRNRSFKDQDLTGANFSYSDLRGCDFSRAILTRANFQHCMTGQSYSQTLLRIAVATTFAIAIASVVAFAFTTTDSSNVTTAGIFAIAITFAFTGTVAIAVFVAGTRIGGTGAVAFIGNFFVAFAFAFAATQAFIESKSIEGIGLSIVSLMLFYFAFSKLLELIEILRNATGTDFWRADLNKVNFSHALLHNVNFSGASTQLSNWENVSFSRCQLPQSFKRREFCYFALIVMVVIKLMPTSI